MARLGNEFKGSRFPLFRNIKDKRKVRSVLIHKIRLKNATSNGYHPALENTMTTLGK